MTAPPPTREEVLEGLRGLLGCWPYSEFQQRAIDRAIAYLETDPAEALAADYAARMVDRAFAIEADTESPFIFGKAAGLREAARMLRDKEGR